MYEHDVEDSEVLRAEYRRPRDVLLSLVGEFMCRATNRLQELNKKNNHDGKVVELLDIKSHVVCDKHFQFFRFYNSATF